MDPAKRKISYARRRSHVKTIEETYNIGSWFKKERKYINPPAVLLQFQPILTEYQIKQLLCANKISTAYTTKIGKETKIWLPLYRIDDWSNSIKNPSLLRSIEKVIKIKFLQKPHSYWWESDFLPKEVRQKIYEKFLVSTKGI